MDTPVTRYVSILKNPKKNLFQSPVDSVKENDLPVHVFSTPLASLSICSNNQKRNRKLGWSPVKRTPVKSPPKKKSREGPWTDDQVRSLIEFVALHKDLQTTNSEWPSMRSDHVYWIKAAEYIQMIDGSTRSATSCRSRVVNQLRLTYATISEAEDAYSCDYEDIREVSNDSGFLENENINSLSPASDVITKVLLKSLQRLDIGQSTELVKQFFQQNSEINKKTLLNSIIQELEDNLLNIYHIFDRSDNITACQRNEMVLKNFDKVSSSDKLCLLDTLFKTVCAENGIKQPPEKFTSLSIKSMDILQKKEKPNVLLDFAKCLGTTRPESDSPLMPVDRMPFGLIQYQLQFFSNSNTKKISIPDDYYQWLETLDAEFEDRLGRLIRGPMWSSLPSSDVGDPLKARVNIAAVSKRTIQRRTSTSEFTTTPKIQTPAVKSITESNPNGRFWLKLDGTDVKESLQHSVKDIWNGDVDLNDGQLDVLRTEYQSRLAWINSIHSTTEEDLKTCLETGLVNLELDEQFLPDAFKKATNDFRKKMNQKTANSETLKGLNWEVVECNTLLQQCLAFMSTFKSDSVSRAAIKSTSQEYQIYLKNLFKKKRTAATHILVIAISDEQRNVKPYALPIQYLPYRSLRDQYVRDITAPIKNALTQAGINVVGLVTDGEFNSLRTQGDTGPLHTWQLVHDSKEVVRKMSKGTLESMLTYAGDDDNGIPFAELPNNYIPSHVLVDIVDMLNDGLTFEDSIVYLRGKLVPEGYTPYPFRKDTPESSIDRLRSLVSTYVYRHTVTTLRSEGRDFSQHLYVPEIDKTTCQQYHERGDHNHILKRIATSTRECRYQELDPEAFDKALLDPRAGLSHAALTGQRPQSVEDAEKLLSYHVAASMQRNGFDCEAEYVSTVAAWHEASDGRGMGQLRRCKANYQMLNYIVADIMPWYQENYDFTYIDVNRPMDNIRGFTRETFVEITTNIESQEERRLQNTELGYPEHPRAATTDDVECFFSLTRRQIGDTFTLSEFQNQWAKIVREFCKRLDPELPFHYWTRNERFRTEESCFDDDTDKKRLHTVRHTQREDCSIFTSGRAFLPARNKQSIRQRLFRVDVGLPPVPDNMQPGRS